MMTGRELSNQDVCSAVCVRSRFERDKLVEPSNREANAAIVRRGHLEKDTKIAIDNPWDMSMLYSPNASSAVLNPSIALLLFSLASAAVAGLYSPG